MYAVVLLFVVILILYVCRLVCFQREDGVPVRISFRNATVY